ncbi:MAG: LLM class flavin-dependent oxidoreductase [Deltaproteobacteria bacterium]|nr:LLM class flavin-dependent oxidoreductase [Deltaproteobacteria bacterium]
MTYSVLRLDMRASQLAGATHPELYAAALDMCVWAEEQGFAMISLPEHHGVDDGYLPSPLTLAGVIAGRTRRIRISIMALLLPLYDPVRLAEDFAVLDLASGGRIGITAGLGYRVEEYQMLGIDWKNRGRVMDEKLDVLLQALRGEEFEWNGRRGRLAPLPGSPPLSLITVGGTGRNAARRAARVGLPFQPSVMNEEVFGFYRTECERLGQTPVLRPPGSGEMLWVSEDPDRSWAEIGQYLLYHAVTYASWQGTNSGGSVVNSEATTIESLRAEQKYKILTPEQCIEYSQSNPNGAVVHFPLCGGTPPELGWQSLELYAAKVLPHVKSSS